MFMTEDPFENDPFEDDEEIEVIFTTDEIIDEPDYEGRDHGQNNWTNAQKEQQDEADQSFEEFMKDLRDGRKKRRQPIKPVLPKALNRVEPKTAAEKLFEQEGYGDGIKLTLVTPPSNPRENFKMNVVELALEERKVNRHYSCTFEEIAELAEAALFLPGLSKDHKANMRFQTRCYFQDIKSESKKIDGSETVAKYVCKLIVSPGYEKYEMFKNHIWIFNIKSNVKIQMSKETPGTYNVYAEYHIFNVKEKHIKE